MLRVDSEFAYAKINRQGILPTHSGNYLAFRNDANPGFIYVKLDQPGPSDPPVRPGLFSTKRFDPKTYGTPQCLYGWKLHISLDDKSLESGWNLAVKILMENNVDCFKVIDEAHRHDLVNNLDHEAGKHITIYCFKEKRDSDGWKKVISEITDIFNRNGIEPGPLPVSDKYINAYFSYRWDSPNSEDSKHILCPFIDFTTDPSLNSPSRPPHPSSHADLAGPSVKFLKPFK